MGQSALGSNRGFESANWATTRLSGVTGPGNGTGPPRSRLAGFAVCPSLQIRTQETAFRKADPSAKVLATLDVPAKVISNICFGGTNRDEIFCTTGDPPGVFHAKVGVKGFQGHPGKPGKVIEEIAVSPNDSASQVYPRRFGSPGGVGQIRGWYVWQKWDPKSRIAEVTKDPPGGETYKVAYCRGRRPTGIWRMAARSMICYRASE